METRKVKAKVSMECSNCYEYFIVEAKTGIYYCPNCNHPVDLEIIEDL